MSSTNCLNVILGSQPNFSFAFDASPSKLSTSVGLKYLSETFIILLPVVLSTPSSSIPSPFHSILRPKNGAAISTNSLTECCSPVAIHNHQVHLAVTLTTLLQHNLLHDPNLSLHQDYQDTIHLETPTDILERPCVILRVTNVSPLLDDS